ncbi:transcription factor ETV7-like isoform X6 [Ostrea edulis]|uniref:transcription factor ETV7-like isoform X6 n=1 Tax=Ostrea edulis TaxID=37623 RepID=UPI0024AF1CAD|nr:transcription factor ETV7-like isoform X6 [Ostrea edulis]
MPLKIPMYTSWTSYPQRQTTALPQPVVPASLAKHPQQWTKEEVAVWLRWCGEEYSIDAVPADKFDMNGKALCLLKRSDFMERVPKNGDLLYNALTKLVQKNSGAFDGHSQTGSPYQNISPSASTFQIPQQFSSPDQTNGGVVLISRSNAQTTPVFTTKVRPFVPILPHPANHITKQEILPVTTVPGILSPAPSPSDTGSGSDVDSCTEYDDRMTCRNPMQASQLNYMNQLRPTIPTGSDLVPFLRSKESGMNCRLLWEFIYQLLQNPYYKEYVCWEKLDDYVFRINNPTGLAQLWGHQKNRTNMTYEKLSRALRYYYRMNIIKKVSGKRLTYKFMQAPSNIQKGQRGAKPHSRSNLLTSCKDEEADDFDDEMRSDDTLTTELSQTSIETRPIKLEVPDDHEFSRTETRDKLTRSMSYPGMMHLSSANNTDINDQPFDFTMTTLKRKEKSVDDSVSSARICTQISFPLAMDHNVPMSTSS